jgi:hypothetical protein
VGDESLMSTVGIGNRHSFSVRTYVALNQYLDFAIRAQPINRYQKARGLVRLETIGCPIFQPKNKIKIHALSISVNYFRRLLPSIFNSTIWTFLIQ